MSLRSVLMKGSPPVMLVKYIGGSFLMVSIEISSSGFEGALNLFPFCTQNVENIYAIILVYY